MVGGVCVIPIEIVKILPVCLIEVRKDCNQRTVNLTVRTPRKRQVDVVVIVHCQPDLLQVVFALGATSGRASLLNGRKQQRNQDRYDGDHDQQFDQCEPRRIREDENNMGQLLRKPKDMDTHTPLCSAGGCAAERG